MVKKVLIALDYDPTAQKVADAGYMLAEAMKAKAILLHVVENEFHYSSLEYSPITGFAGITDINPMKVESVEWAKNVSLKFLEKMKKHLGNETIKTVVADGDIAGGIIKTAKENHADIIVTGSHSRRWLEEILMGSVTEKVLHQTSIPLYIVPTKKQD
jgi:nucleotide-binding universal stress UspA family protein